MRLFIAIPLSDEIKKHLNTLKDIIKARTVKEFHLTLKFLGEMPEQKLEDIVEILEAISFEPFEFKLKDIGFFPNERKPRVVWVGVEPWKDILALQKNIDIGLQSLCPRDKKFHPHITMARIKRPGFRMDRVVIKPLKLRVESFELIKSTLTPDGPIHETVKNHRAIGR